MCRVSEYWRWGIRPGDEIFFTHICPGLQLNDSERKDLPGYGPALAEPLKQKSPCSETVLWFLPGVPLLFESSSLPVGSGLGFAIAREFGIFTAMKKNTFIVEIIRTCMFILPLRILLSFYAYACFPPNDRRISCNFICSAPVEYLRMCY